MQTMLSISRAISRLCLFSPRLEPRSPSFTALSHLHTEHVPVGDRSTHYYHLREGEGGPHTFPKSFNDTDGAKQEIEAIGTDNCDTCACVYVPLTPTQCFAAHIKAWLHTPGGDDHDTWCPGPAKGKVLTKLIISKLEHCIDPELLEGNKQERSQRSMIVCPRQVYCSDTSSGSYILDAVQQFFQLGDEVRKSHASEIQRPHGFGVDHFSSKRQLFLREKALTVRGWRQREPEEYGWVRLNPAQKGREEDASAWCFVSHEGRWKRFSEYKQHREEEQHSKLW